MMEFANTDWLYAFLLIPVLLWLHVFLERRKYKQLKQQISEAFWPELLSPINRFNQRFRLLMWAVGVGMLLIAIAQPRWGFQWQEVPQKGTDLLIALDVSQSMLAEDLHPNRITSAQREVQDLLDMLEGERVGLLAFAGVSFLQSPLTQDYGAIELFMEDLGTELIPVQGTNLTHVLEGAAKAFQQSDSQSKAIILLTDGGETRSEMETVIEVARQQGIRIYVLGIGRPDGAPIPLKKGGFLKDDQGNMVIATLNEDSLRELAHSTGGLYVRSLPGNEDLSYLYHDGVRKLNQSEEYGQSKKKIWNEVFQWFLAVALGLLTLEALISVVARERA